LNIKIENQTLQPYTVREKGFFPSKNARFSKFFVLYITLFERVFKDKKSRNE
jgi:hypothetical protein